MKANVFFKTVCVAVVMVVTATMVKAQSGSYYSNDVMNGDQVATRFVYKMDNGLQYHMKYDFTYDHENRLATKETFQWNSKTQNWQPENRIEYTYENGEIVMECNRWNKKDKEYKEMAMQSFQDINSTQVYMAQLTAK